MQVTKKKNHKKRIIISLVILLLVSTGVVVTYALLRNQPKDTDTKSSSNSKSISKKTDTAKHDSKNDSEPVDTPAVVEKEKEKDHPTSYEGSNPNTSNSLTGFINYKAVVGNALSLRVTIDQSISSGVCALTLSSNDRTVTKTVPVVQNPSSATCEGFSIPVSELGSGKWDISLTITSDDRAGTFKDSVTI